MVRGEEGLVVREVLQLASVRRSGDLIAGNPSVHELGKISNSKVVLSFEGYSNTLATHSLVVEGSDVDSVLVV